MLQIKTIWQINTYTFKKNITSFSIITIITIAIISSIIIAFMFKNPYLQEIVLKLYYIFCQIAFKNLFDKKKQHLEFIQISFQGKILKCIYMHNARCVLTNMSGVEKMNHCVFTKKCQSCRAMVSTAGSQEITQFWVYKIASHNFVCTEVVRLPKLYLCINACACVIISVPILYIW